MEGRPDWTELLFSSAGRLPRASFTALAAVLVGLGWLCRASHIGWFAGAACYAVLLFCGAAVACKRLHDRGRSGWWAVILFAALAAVWTASPPVLAAPAQLALGWAVIELCGLPGVKGPNRYGPDPRRSIRV